MLFFNPSFNLDFGFKERIFNRKLIVFGFSHYFGYPFRAHFGDKKSTLYKKRASLLYFKRSFIPHCFYPIFCLGEVRVILCWVPARGTCGIPAGQGIFQF